MSVIIGHASIDERGKAKGGVAGNQSGKEVCTRTWYNKPFKYILRPKSNKLAEKMALMCEQGCSNRNIGYDQNERNTLHTLAKAVGYDLRKIDKPCETDCSAFMTVCAIGGGVSALEYNGNAPTTSTMVNVFKATKQFYVIDKTSILTTDKYLRRGDILVAPGSHTVMVLSNGLYWYEVLEGTKGTMEVEVQKRLASKGYSVGNIDGDIGINSVRAIKEFQKDNGLITDGVVGLKTYKMLGIIL